MAELIARLRLWLSGWWRRNVIDDAPPYTDDEAERWKHRG